MATIELNDTTIYYERSGQGPALLFVHGAFGDADNWADQAPRFSDRYRCVAYDRRGYTRSAPDDAALSTTQHADDAAALIEALELAPCLVVGSSSGAAIAVDLALRHGHLLRGVVLCEPPLFSLDPAAGEAAMSELAPRLDVAMASGGPRAAVEAFASFAFPEGWAMLDENRRDRLRANADVGFADVQSPPLEIGPTDLSTVGVPALVIVGTISHPAMRSITKVLAAALPDARFVEVEGGHVPYIEHPDEFAHIVSVFAAELDR